MKNKFLHNSLLYSLLIFVCACASADFIANNFKTKTINHKVVAVMPVEMVFRGNLPKNLTDEQVNQIEEAESKAFQTSLYNNLLKQSGSDKKDIKITFSTIEKINSELADNSIDIRSSWYMDPEELAKILHVDAVIKCKIEKTRYMSDLASFGIDLGVVILEGVFDGILYPIPYGLGRTNDIVAECSLFNGSDGTLLYKDVYIRATDYSVLANEIIDDLTKKFSRTFPYRDK